MTVACQAPLSMEFSRQKYLSGLPFFSPGDLLDPGIEHTSLPLQADSYHLSHQGSIYVILCNIVCNCNYVILSRNYSTGCMQARKQQLELDMEQQTGSK